MTDTTIPLSKAITKGLSEVTRERTLLIHAQQMGNGNPKVINFRGDVAEDYQYDKIKPLSTKAQAMGNVVVIEGESQKTGTVGNYQILANQWGLLEALAKLG
ncbi:MAG: hypothetical protein PHE74_00655 [Comamonas sp.]|jgi:hypothetical protein|nr:hypothetical protein [Comamonas sp.]